jgi:hypothetical protein
MSPISWSETPPGWTASQDGVPVCHLKPKDIGGCTATWLNDRLWPAPSHMPRAAPQGARFFSSVSDAKAAVEQLFAP